MRCNDVAGSGRKRSAARTRATRSACNRIDLHPSATPSSFFPTEDSFAVFPVERQMYREPTYRGSFRLRSPDSSSRYFLAINAHRFTRDRPVDSSTNRSSPLLFPFSTRDREREKERERRNRKSLLRRLDQS